MGSLERTLDAGQVTVVNQRNPFGISDAPDPDGQDVAAFAAGVTLDGSPEDANGQPWAQAGGGRRQGIIEARRVGERRLVGRYLNLSDPAITSPWVGVVVDNTRIDGRHSAGRIDFRR